MINKSILKQCLKSNGKMWAVFTAAAVAFLALIICTFDPTAFSAIASAAEGTALSGVTENLGSLLGTLETYYSMVAVLLGLVFVYLTSNSLVVEEVDSGSMAYTLSTPIRRSSVVITKMTYLIVSLALMMGVIAGSGYAITELRWGAVSDTAITDDVSVAAKSMNKDADYVRTHLYVIKDDAEALSVGADARDLDEDSYLAYLDMKMDDNAYKAAAKELTKNRFDQYEDVTGDDRPDNDEIEITKEELEADPSLMLDDDDALKAGAEPKGMTLIEYRDYIQQIVDEQNASEGETADAEATAGSTAEADSSTSDDGTVAATDAEAAALADATTLTLTDPSDIMQVAMMASAEALDTDTATLSDNLILMKEQKALDAASAATGVPAEQLTELVNQSMASAALSEDNGISFDNEAYAWLNFGCFLLLLAISAIGFFASCVFNRSKTAMALGGGLPFAFFLIEVITQMGESLENLKYFTINTLFDTEKIVAMDNFAPGLCALAGIAVTLYAAGCAIFCKKDLPL
ncbi:ABC transporter permease subunit [Bifidobacterium eulemuris]|uniref:ABC transporter permease n=1 Tax=Bifidobacterium eulemuris TaxID=1765219 RepID=A0A261G9L9_9BIFI|nr:ABC transporter permease subunit [Bifidobacterium eulemuris]OZG68108.1 ABC transporter permease [Bifidobacterium eulemuris]QOL31825.1 ABC transporter permease subunit [Bifidobacterium eulemuris]